MKFIIGLYPKSETDQCIYGYDSTKNKSFISDPLPSSVLPKTKNGETGLFVSRKKEAVLGNFFAECVLDPSVCKSFTISFVVYIEGSLAMDDFYTLLTPCQKPKVTITLVSQWRGTLPVWRRRRMLWLVNLLTYWRNQESFLAPAFGFTLAWYLLQLQELGNCTWMVKRQSIQN